MPKVDCITSVHHVFTVNNSELVYRELVCIEGHEELTDCVCFHWTRFWGPRKEAVSMYAVDDWVQVDYNGVQYYGRIVDVDTNSGYKLTVMHPAGRKNWKWPQTADCIYYTEDKVLRKISAPKPIGKRGQFAFELA